MSPQAARFRLEPRKLILAVLILSFLVLMANRWGQVEELLATLRRGRIAWIVIALMFQAGTLLNQPALYQALYRLLDLPIRWRDLVPVVWAAHFVNIVTPAAGLGGTALLFDEARRRRFDMGRVTLANTLYFLLNFIWFVILLGFSLVMLFLWHDLKSYEIAVAAVPAVGVVLALIALFLVSTRPQTFSRLVLALVRGLNWVGLRLLRREVLAPDKAREMAATFADSIGTLRSARGRLWRPWFHAMLVDVLEMLVLGACFAAFPGAGREVTPAMLVTGYSLGTLFLVVSITPQGLGVVEGVMTAIFVSLGVSFERATVVVLVYRGLSFWLPLIVGFLALNWAPNLKTHSVNQAPIDVYRE